MRTQFFASFQPILETTALEKTPEPEVARVESRKNKRMGSSLLFPVVLAAGLALPFSGCVSNPSAEYAITIPPEPATFEATYALEAGAIHGNVTATGAIAERGLLGDGSVLTLPAIHLNISLSDPTTKTFLVTHFLGSNGTLATASITCQGCAAGVDRRFVPDALGRPSFFGLGPFLGTSLQTGQTGRLTLWDSQLPGELRWAVGSAPAGPRGIKCVWIEWSGTVGAKVPVLFSPSAGRILACEDAPLPMVVESPGWRIERMQASWTASAARPSFTPPITRSSACGFQEPTHNDTVLPNGIYMDWAKENDPYIAAWARTHPEGIALGGYGESLSPEVGDGLTATYPVGAILLLYDPAEGAMELREINESHTVVSPARQPVQSSMLASSDWMVVRNVPPDRASTPCDGEPVQLKSLAESVVPLMPTASDVWVIVAPELLLPAQDSAGLLGPFAKENAPDFLAEPWPPRAFVITEPPGSIGTLSGASLDIRTGWIRWMEIDASAWEA
jgi:hypothetical protein